MPESFTELRRPVARRARSWRWLVGLIGALPIIVFYGFFWREVVNVPYQDDFDGLLEPALLFSKPDLTAAEAWAMYWRQDDEHRIIIDRLVVHAQYWLTGQFNFRYHSLLGSLVVLLTLAVCWRWFRANRWKPWLFLPVPFLLFSPQYYDAIQWSIVPLQHMAVYAWALVTLWLLSRDTSRTFGWAIVTGLLSLLSDVTGALPLVIGIGLLLVQQRWQRLAIWTGLTVASLAVYFYRLEVPPFRPSLADNLALPCQMVHLWVAMQGMWADIAPFLPMTARTGAVLLAGVVVVGLWTGGLGRRLWQFYRTRQLPDRQSQFLYGGVLLFLAVFTLFALNRTVEGLLPAFLTRYRFMHMTWLVLLYLLLLTELPARLRHRNWLAGVVVGGSLVYWLTSWFQYGPSAHLFRQTQLADLHGWQHQRVIPSTPIYPLHKRAIDTWMQQAQTKGLFRYENAALDALTDAPVVGQASVLLASDRDWLTVTLVSMPHPAFPALADVYVLLRDRNAPNRVPLIFPATPTRSSMAGWLANSRLLTTPYSTHTILKRYLTDANPIIEIGVVDGGRVVRYQTGQKPTL